MIALVQAQLQVDRLVVQRYIRIIRAGQRRGADFSLAEIAVYLVLRLSVCIQADRSFVQIRVVQLPETLVGQRDFELL